MAVFEELPNRSNWGYLENIGVCQPDYFRQGNQNLSIECTINGDYNITSGNVECRAISCENATFELFRGFDAVSTANLV